VIRDLGGDVSTDANFDSSATHLLCMRLSRNEKMLSSIASGKWILHCSYLQDSKRQGRFLDVSIFVKNNKDLSEEICQYLAHFSSDLKNRKKNKKKDSIASLFTLRLCFYDVNCE